MKYPISSTIFITTMLLHIIAILTDHQGDQFWMCGAFPALLACAMFVAFMEQQKDPKEAILRPVTQDDKTNAFIGCTLTFFLIVGSIVAFWFIFLHR